jgi:alpha-L-arabinofuranosidase
MRLSAVMLAAALLAGLANAQSPATVTATVTIRADQPGPTINRNLYGQFAEHLGRGIYEGVWVGENSSIPNTRGYRNDVIEALRKLRVPVVRWPGGCFADEYHWREGIGPRDKRPVKINTTWGGVEEDNSFGTHEFLDFAELIGAEAYVAGNVGSGSPQETAEWVEYITSDTKSTLAELRRKNGRAKPWRLPYFGVGNENWGCGGNMRPEFYADLYRQFATFIKAPRENRPQRIAGGANVDDYKWTEVLMSQATRHMEALSLHYYTFPNKWENKGSSTGFTEDAWASTLRNAMRIDELVTKHSEIMNKYDPEKKIGLYVDEWGTWYSPEQGHNPAFLYQQNTIRDAVVAALSLNVFHKHAERVRMANIAQMVNVLQAMILTDKEKMVLTPTYHVFEMYVPFQDTKSLPVEIKTPDYQRGDITLPAVNASAARDSSGRIHLSLVNLDPSRTASVTTTLSGASARAASGRVLTGTALDARNTFDKPTTVQPAALSGKRQGDRIVVQIPPKSVAVLTLTQ